MERRTKHNIMIGVVAGIGILLILSALWYFGKEYWFSKYYNKQFNISMKYPSQWTFEENKNGAVVIFYSPQQNDLDYFQENVNVVVQDIAGNPMELRKYSDLAIKQMEAVFHENMIIIDSSPTFIAGQAGYKLEFIGKAPETDFRYLSVWTILGLQAYQVTYTALASQYEHFLPKVNRMINFFQFK